MGLTGRGGARLLALGLPEVPDLSAAAAAAKKGLPIGLEKAMVMQAASASVRCPGLLRGVAV